MQHICCQQSASCCGQQHGGRQRVRLQIHIAAHAQQAKTQKHRHFAQSAIAIRSPPQGVCQRCRNRQRAQQQKHQPIAPAMQTHQQQRHATCRCRQRSRHQPTPHRRRAQLSRSHCPRGRILAAIGICAAQGIAVIVGDIGQNLQQQHREQR